MTDIDRVMGYLFNGGMVVVIVYCLWLLYRVVKDAWLKYKQPPRKPDSILRTSNGKIRRRNEE